MNNQEEKSLDDLWKDLRDEIELKYEIDFGHGHINRKADLWEARIQTLDNRLFFIGEGPTRKEALIDAFKKAKLGLASDEAIEE